MKDFFESPKARRLMGALMALTGLAMLFTDRSEFVGIVVLVCGVLIIGQSFGIVPMRRPRR